MIMATSTITRYHETNPESSKSNENILHSSSTVASCLASNYPKSFPEKFQDFFATLSDDVDDLPSMLEDKLIPRKSESIEQKGRRWTKRTFQRRSSEVEVQLFKSTFSNNERLTVDGRSKSPIPSRRRSSSIALARPTPDLHRFLQTEAGPWGHLTPSSSTQRSPTRPTLATSPGAISSGSVQQHQRCDRQHRGRTSSMPAVPRRPMLSEMKRTGMPNTEEIEADGIEYYRLRSFSITSNGVFNLGDSLKSRRSRSINSVTSSGTSCRDARLLSSASQHSCIEGDGESNGQVATYKVGMLGAPGVGKTALTVQFTTSEYICAYDASLDDEYGQKSVSVMIDGQETELEIIDHPSVEMSIESFCATYKPDVYVVVYSVVDKQSFKVAEEMLLYLWKSDYSAGVILVGNKVDLERLREVTSLMGRRLAANCGCKFIETSSGLAHHVDELLVGILAQIKLNPQRNMDGTSRRRRSKNRRKILKHLLGFKRKTKSCENLFTL